MSLKCPKCGEEEEIYGNREGIFCEKCGHKLTKGKRTSERRLQNIIRRMLEGEDFYTNFSPRITNAEIKEIENKLDLALQREHTAGAIAGPIAIYQLHPEEFETKAKAYLCENEIKRKKV